MKAFLRDAGAQRSSPSRRQCFLLRRLRRTSVNPLVGQEAGGLVLHQGAQAVSRADQLLHLGLVALKVLMGHVSGRNSAGG